MGLPKTLAGIIGFVLISGYVIGLVLDNDTNTAQLESLVSEMQNATGQNLNQSESSAGLSGFFSVLQSQLSMFWTTIQILLTSIGMFVAIPALRGLPAESYIIFALIFILAIIAIIKVVWSGE